MSLMERLGFGSNTPAASGTAHTAPVPGILNGIPGVVDTSSIQQIPQTVVTTQQPQPTPPEDMFKDLWSNDPKQEEQQGINFNIAPDKLQELATKNIDLGNLMTPDLQQRIMAGGQDALAALTEAMNITGRTVYANSIQGTTKLVQMAAQDAEARITASLESKFKLMGLNDHLANTNPALQDPMLKPIVESCKAQVVKKFPNASSTEIAKITDQYFNQIAAKLAPGLSKPAPQVDYQGKPVQQEIDWAAYLNS